MTIYHDSLSLAQQHPIAQSWPSLRAALERAKINEATSWKLPAIGCAAFGGEGIAALPAVAAMACCQISVLLVDDILDQDPRGEYHQIGEGLAANLASGFAALAVALLLDDPHLADSRPAARAMTHMMATVAHGQELDVRNQAREDHYWQVTRLKSALYFGTGLYLGSFYAGAKATAAQTLLDFGEIYGEIMQIHDDLNDCLASPANPDWYEGRYPLPILFAEIVDHPQRQRFLDLRPQVAGNQDALEEAQAILVSCGAISYSVNELMLRHENAAQRLAGMSLPHPEPLQRLLAEVIEPVRHLFAQVGAPMASFNG